MVLLQAAAVAVRGITQALFRLEALAVAVLVVEAAVELLSTQLLVQQTQVVEAVAVE